MEKLTFLVEYYKYHNEVPRIFTVTIRELMEKFWNRKRKCEYYKVKAILNSDKKKNKKKIQLDSKNYSLILKELIESIVITPKLSNVS